jgi:MFS family permease
MTSVRVALIWATLVAAICVPIALAMTSDLLEWRGPVYILAGFAGIFALGLLLVQPLLIAGYLPGFSAYRARRAHHWTGGALVTAVVVHVGGSLDHKSAGHARRAYLRIADAHNEGTVATAEVIDLVAEASLPASLSWKVPGIAVFRAGRIELKSPQLPRCAASLSCVYQSRRRLQGTPGTAPRAICGATLDPVVYFRLQPAHGAEAEWDRARESSTIHHLV